MDAFSIAANSAVSAIHRFDQAARDTVRDTTIATTDSAKPNTPSPNGIGGDLTTDVVNQIQSQTAFQASISVIKTADQMTGRLLDIKA